MFWLDTWLNMPKHAQVWLCNWSVTTRLILESDLQVSLSLVPRPYTRASERVWLHKSKSLGPLQNLKASNEIAKQR